MQNSWAYKSPQKLKKLVKWCAFGGQLFTKKWKFSTFGAAFPPRALIGMKFCMAKQTHCPLGHA